ncbi:hypothetical protein BDE02_12G053200 [Populus trichocarpa]|nr:hypothetical protein BDE02_12G053200 [Populus trichocarpa]
MNSPAFRFSTGSEMGLENLTGWRGVVLRHGVQW